MLAHHGCPGSVKVAADLLGFILITTATIYIGYKNAVYKGPSGTERNFNGYREENMLSLFVNLFASVAYWARVIANANCTPGFAIFTQIRYADYLATCPLLVLDLLWNLEGPYKCTSGGLIFITILTGVACSIVPAPQSYMWFAFGDVIFVSTYITLVFLVRQRLNYFVSHAKNQKALKAMYYIKFACACFFMIWIWYPLIWILSPYCLHILHIEVVDFLHMLLDVGAKSLYGIVLLWFRWNYDKKLLRNIEEEEYIEFSSRFPDRKAKMHIKIEEEEEEIPQSPGKEKIQMTVSSSGLIQPYIVNSSAADSGDKAEPEEPRGKGTYGTGSRLLFQSNRRKSEVMKTIILPSSPVRQSAAARSQSRDIQEPWLTDLVTYLEDRGVAGAQVAVARLEQSGVTEEQLRTCVTDDELEDAGIDAAARRAILARYNGRGGNNPPWNLTNDAYMSPLMQNHAPQEELRAWTPTDFN